MTAHRPELPEHSVWPTVLILVVCATAAAFISVLLALIATMVGIGPFGWVLYGPAIIITFGSAATISLIATPVWALLAGGYFALRACYERGSTVSDLKVRFFSETHELAVETQRLAKLMGLPPVAHIGWFANEEINAFAMGTSKSNALIAVSKGAVERLTKAELMAVLAHELGHVASNDMARMTFARGIQNSLTFFLIFRGLKKTARWIFTPLSELEILRLSRAREYTADLIAAMMVGAPNMIAALEKLRREEAPKPQGYGNVLMWSGFGSGGLFSTHPPLEQRIERLKELPERYHQTSAYAA